MADYRLRHQRDGNAGATILYHLRICRRPHSSSLAGTTAGRRDLLGMGTAAASSEAAGPAQGLRAGWSSGRTETGVQHCERISAITYIPCAVNLMCALATKEEILKGIQQRLGRVIFTVSYSRIFFTAKQV